MTKLRTFLSRLLGSFGRRHDDRELSEDVEAHLELLTDDYVRRGLTPRAARAAAMRDFGNVGAMQDVYREQRGLLWLDDVRRDLRRLRQRDRGAVQAARRSAGLLQRLLPQPPLDRSRAHAGAFRKEGAFRFH